MATKHTPEPWRVEEWTCHAPTCIRAGDVTVADCSGFGRYADETIPDAARIVQCVNACAGIEDPAAALKMAKDALNLIKAVIVDSDHWWMDCPDRGGFDLDDINRTLAALNGKG